MLEKVRASLLPPLGKQLLFEGGLRSCYLVAQAHGYWLVCIWCIMVKFQGGGDGLKSLVCAGLWLY